LNNNKKPQLPKSQSNPKIAVIIPAKNEENYISKTLEYLLNQDLKPYRIIVVNDGSTDKTGEIASHFKEVEVINRENRTENFVARKELANTFNLGLTELNNENDCEFIMILGADQILPKEYLSKITKRMFLNPKIAIASGVIKNEYSKVPRGAGRVVRYDFWKKLGLKYPINYRFEGYLILKAQSLGFKVASYPDIIFETQRKTGSTLEPKRYYYSGLGLKALGYTFPYAFVIILSLFKKNPRGAYHMLRGYFSNYNDLYERELREYVRKTQHRNIFHI